MCSLSEVNYDSIIATRYQENAESMSQMSTLQGVRVSVLRLKANRDVTGGRLKQSERAAEGKTFRSSKGSGSEDSAWHK